MKLSFEVKPIEQFFEKFLYGFWDRKFHSLPRIYLDEMAFFNLIFRF